MKLRVLFLIAILLQGFLQVIGDENDNDEYDEVRKSAIEDANRPERPFGNVFRSTSPSPRYRRGIFGLIGKGLKSIPKYIKKVPKVIKPIWKSKPVALASRFISSERVDVVLEIADLVLSVGNALTDGCQSYQDLCDARKQLVKLEVEIKKLEREILKWERSGKFQNLGDFYQMNVRLEQKMNSLIEDMTSTSAFPLNITDNHSTFNNTKTFSEELLAQASSISLALNEFENFMHEYEVNTLTYTAISILVKYRMQNAFSALSRKNKAKLQELTSDILDDQAKTRKGEVNNKISKKYGRKFSKSKLVMKAFQNNIKDVRKSISNKIPVIVKKGYRSKTKQLSKKIATLRNSGIGKYKFMKSIKAKFNSPKLKRAVKLCKKIASPIISKGSSVAGIITTDLHYRRMTKAAVDLQNEYEDVINLMRSMINEFNQSYALSLKFARDNFTCIAETFNSLVYNNTDEIFLTKILPPKNIPGGIGIQLSKTFSDANETNLMPKQLNLLAILNDPRYNIEKLKNWLKVRSYLVKEVSSNPEKSVQDINETLSIIYDASELDDFKQFGKRITIVDVLCMIAVVRFDRELYDYFNISSIREKCTQDTASVSIEQVLRDRMEELVNSKIQFYVDSKKGVSKDVPLSEIIVDINRILRLDKYMIMVSSDETVLTEKCILCKIAKLYPEESSYYYYQLSLFRQRCLDMSDNEFAKLRNRAAQKRNDAERYELSRMFQGSKMTSTEYSRFKPSVTHSLQTLSVSHYISPPTLFSEIPKLKPANAVSDVLPDKSTESILRIIQEKNHERNTIPRSETMPSGKLDKTIMHSSGNNAMYMTNLGLFIMMMILYIFYFVLM